jgi:hypothetical protein
VRTPAAQEAAVCSAREAAERACEVALAAQLEQQLAAREAAVAATRHEAEAQAARQLGAAHAAAAAAAASEAARRDEEVRTIRTQLDQCQRLYAASEATAAERGHELVSEFAQLLPIGLGQAPNALDALANTVGSFRRAAQLSIRRCCNWQKQAIAPRTFTRRMGLKI